MDTLQLYSEFRKNLNAVKRQSERMGARIVAGTFNSSHAHDGIRSNAFDVWQIRLQMLWDATGTVDLTTKDYGRPLAWLQNKGLDPFRLTDALTERDRPKVIAFFRADLAEPTFAVAPALGALKISMEAARDFVAANYPVSGSTDLGSTFDANGDKVSVVFTAGEMDGLAPLLVDVSIKVSALLPR